ncbi:hypothetical protein V22_10930 [Calycomorphotria hydatis]|uniref:Uncharacterized protein n=1 Tax=Calycomorphotria hydatis TaxID=2528027 RepID=A0A517T660_9PLAN|nr:hypothetical protein V22_10930 [Calycomorphotria hydatis]
MEEFTMLSVMEMKELIALIQKTWNKRVGIASCGDI